MNAWRYSRLAAFAAAVLWSTVAAAQSAQITPVSGPSALSRLGLTDPAHVDGVGGTLGAASGISGVAGTSRCRLARRHVSRGYADRRGHLSSRLPGLPQDRWQRSAAGNQLPHRAGPGDLADALGRAHETGGECTIDEAFARQVVSGARTDLLKRLSQGGQKMPPFAFLRDDERESLLAYLEAIAGVPNSRRKQRSVAESPMRVGEHIVKGTCHICHNAVGAWPDPEGPLNNAVPSLASLTNIARWTSRPEGAAWHARRDGYCAGLL